MKKRVLAFLMAFTLVMPMFAVSAFAAVDAVYNAVEDGLASFSFEGPGEERSLQAYISGDDLYAEVDEDAEDAEVDEDAVAFDRDANFDNTTWIEQQDADSDGKWADVPVGRTDEIAPQDGKTLSVWSNNDFVGSFDIVALQAIGATLDPVTKIVTVTLNRLATQEVPVLVRLNGALIDIEASTEAESDTVVIDVATYLSNNDDGTYILEVAVDNSLEKWVACGDFEVVGGLETAIFDESTNVITINSAKVKNDTLVYIECKGEDWAKLGTAIIPAGAYSVDYTVTAFTAPGTYEFRVSLDQVNWISVTNTYTVGGIQATSVKIDDAMKNGLKVYTSGEFKLVYDVEPNDYSNIAVTSASPAVLSIATGVNKWVYTALKSGNAIVQVKVDSTITDTQIIRVVP